MEDARFFIKRGEARYGPYTKAQIRSGLEQSRVTLDDLVWRDGMAEWVSVSTLLADDHPDLPPPIESVPPGSLSVTTSQVAAQEQLFGPTAKRHAGSIDAVMKASLRREVIFGGLWRRAAAALIDTFLLVVVFFSLGFVAAVTRRWLFDSQASSSLEAWLNLLGLIVTWLYYALLHSSNYQATFGKMALGMRVVDSRGDRLSFARASGRYFATWITSLTLGIGLLMVAWTKRRQALHDMLAGTVVIRRDVAREDLVAYEQGLERPTR